VTVSATLEGEGEVEIKVLLEPAAQLEVAMSVHTSHASPAVVSPVLIPHPKSFTPIVRESTACTRLGRLALESLCGVGRGYPCRSEEPKQERETRENSYKSDLQTC